MTHPFKPHVFNSLGTINSESLTFLDTKEHRLSQSKPVQTVMCVKSNSQKENQLYSMPTRALIYCSLS